MSTSRRWYERALGGALVLAGLCVVIPIAVFWVVYARHYYTVGLSINLLPELLPIIVIGSVVVVLGGIELLRRP
jgi:hypothetical protein